MKIRSYNLESVIADKKKDLNRKRFIKRFLRNDSRKKTKGINKYGGKCK